MSVLGVERIGGTPRTVSGISQINGGGTINPLNTDTLNSVSGNGITVEDSLLLDSGKRVRTDELDSTSNLGITTNDSLLLPVGKKIRTDQISATTTSATTETVTFPGPIYAGKINTTESQIQSGADKLHITCNGGYSDSVLLEAGASGGVTFNANSYTFMGVTPPYSNGIPLITQTGTIGLTNKTMSTGCKWSGNTIAATRGGTGISSYAVGDIPYSNATNTLAVLSGNTTTTPCYLSQTGSGSASAAPSWKTPTSIKTDLSLNNVENTALSTWTGSTNLTTLGPSGSYTVTLSDGAGNNFTMSSTSGRYVKVGPLTWFWAHPAWTSKGSAIAGNNLTMTLPSIPSVAAYYPFAIGYSSGAGNPTTGLGVNSTSTMNFLTGGSSYITISACGAAGEIYVSGIYT